MRVFGNSPLNNARTMTELDDTTTDYYISWTKKDSNFAKLISCRLRKKDPSKNAPRGLLTKNDLKPGFPHWGRWGCRAFPPTLAVFNLVLMSQLAGKQKLVLWNELQPSGQGPMSKVFFLACWYLIYLVYPSLYPSFLFPYPSWTTLLNHFRKLWPPCTARKY